MWVQIQAKNFLAYVFASLVLEPHTARARGRNGGAPYKMTTAKLRLAQVAMKKKETKISELCKELGITQQTLYRHVSPNGELRNDGKKLLKIP